MSHYAVAVFTKEDGKDVEELLEPYWEGLSVPHYISKEQMIREAREEIEKYKAGTYAEYLKDPDGYVEKYKEKDGHIRYITEEFPKKLMWTDEDCYADKLKWYNEDKIQPDGSVYDDYNPNSKWDWYSIGGRFSGSIPLNNGEFCDEADMSEVNIGYRDKEKYDRVIRFWKVYIEGEEPKDDDEKEYLNDWYKKEYYTDRYDSAEEYAADCSDFTFYAALLPDGQWIEPGQMGWFGCSSAEAEDDKAWRKKRKEILQKAKKENWYITMVDCHI